MMHSLPESVRQQYLSAMGVTQWYARVPVANGSSIDWSTETGAETTAAPADAVVDPAKPSDPAGSPVAVTSTPARATEADATAAATPPVARAPHETIPDPAPKPAAQRVETTNVSPADPLPSAPRAQGIEFGQRWWAHGGWLIIDTRPPGLSERQKTAADRLLANLAQVACGVRAPEVTHLFDWPLFVNRSIKHDLEEAQFYVRQKWRAIQQQTPTTHLVLLGERSEALLTPALAENEGPSDPKAAGGEAVTVWHQGKIRCLSGPGTSELLHLPGMKRRLWLALQAWEAAAI